MPLMCWINGVLFEQKRLDSAPEAVNPQIRSWRSSQNKFQSSAQPQWRHHDCNMSIYLSGMVKHRQHHCVCWVCPLPYPSLGVRAPQLAPLVTMAAHPTWTTLCHHCGKLSISNECNADKCLVQNARSVHSLCDLSLPTDRNTVQIKTMDRVNTMVNTTL